MSTTTNLSTFKINYLTKAQYETALNNGTINENELYLTPDTSSGGTTYTFANGTNGFTVTPQGGSAQTVTVTPSITNNITGVSASVTLATNSWSNNTQSVTVNGVTASNHIIVSPAPASIDNYSSAAIKCTGQASNSLTFTCETVPSSAITVNILILN